MPLGVPLGLRQAGRGGAGQGVLTAAGGAKAPRHRVRAGRG